MYLVKAKKRRAIKCLAFEQQVPKQNSVATLWGGTMFRRLNIADVPPVRRVRRSHCNIQDVGDFGGEAQTSMLWHLPDLRFHLAKSCSRHSPAVSGVRAPAAVTVWGLRWPFCTFKEGLGSGSFLLACTANVICSSPVVIPLRFFDPPETLVLVIMS